MKKIKLCIILTLIILINLLAFSLSYSALKSDSTVDNTNSVADFVVNYERLSLKRTSNKGKTEIIPVNNNDTSIIVPDIKPEDIINYEFAIYNQKIDLNNEVLMKITITFSSYLKMRQSDNTFKDYYISMAKDYSPNSVNGNEIDKYLVNAKLNLYKYVNNDYKIISKIGTEVDYKLESVYIEGNDTLAKITHKVGFYLQPHSVVNQEAKFLLSATIPGQASNMEAYAGASYVIDLDIRGEQVLEVV